MWWENDIWNEMERLRSQLDDIYTGRGGSRISRAFPHVNIYESDNDVKVYAEMAGMSKDDIEISFEDGNLIIKGERKGCCEDEKMTLVRGERAVGKFDKSIEIPVKVETGKISAKFKSGILEIVLPKAEDVKPKQISIDVK